MFYTLLPRPGGGCSSISGELYGSLVAISFVQAWAGISRHAPMRISALVDKDFGRLRFWAPSCNPSFVFFSGMLISVDRYRWCLHTVNSGQSLSFSLYSLGCMHGQDIFVAKAKTK
jgi:hypothetical protein